MPGNVVEFMAAQHGEAQNITHTIEIIKHKLGMDAPIYVQYGKWLGGVLRGDLGRSLWTDRSIGPDFLLRLPVSIELGILAIIVALLVALPIGILSAIPRVI